MKIRDVIIIGKGPAGISTALYTKRANLDTVVIGREGSSLDKAEKIENYYGLKEVLSGADILKIGENQAEKLGIELIKDEVTSITQLYEENYFKVTSITGEHYAKAILLATGQPSKKVKIEGLSVFEGKGISYCTTCDGFFYRNLKVGVLGNSAYAIHEATELEAFTKDITIFTNGDELNINSDMSDEAGRFKINTKPIIEVSGDEYLQNIHFRDGKTQQIDGLFIAYGSASSVDFAKKLGIVVENNSIKVNNDQSTNIEGIFAAGDCTGGFKQIATAVGQGAIAAKSIIEYLRRKR